MVRKELEKYIGKYVEITLFGEIRTEDVLSIIRKGGLNGIKGTHRKNT